MFPWKMLPSHCCITFAKAMLSVSLSLPSGGESSNMTRPEICPFMSFPFCYLVTCKCPFQCLSLEFNWKQVNQIHFLRLKIQLDIQKSLDPQNASLQKKKNTKRFHRSAHPFRPCTDASSRNIFPNAASAVPSSQLASRCSACSNGVRKRTRVTNRYNCHVKKKHANYWCLYFREFQNCKLTWVIGAESYKYMNHSSNSCSPCAPALAIDCQSSFLADQWHDLDNHAPSKSKQRSQSMDFCEVSKVNKFTCCAERFFSCFGLSPKLSIVFFQPFVAWNYFWCNNFWTCEVFQK